MVVRSARSALSHTVALNLIVENLISNDILLSRLIHCIIFVSHHTNKKKKVEYKKKFPYMQRAPM